MSDRRSKLLWSVVIVGAVIFTGLLWTSAGTKAVAPPPDNFSNAGAAVSSPTVAKALSQVNQVQAKATPTPVTIEAEPITLKPSGFEPSEIRRTASPFVLAINNRSRLADVSFELFKEDGHKTHDVKGPKGQVHPMKLIDLPPGNYLLKEVNHPEWVCRIVLSR